MSFQLRIITWPRLCGRWGEKGWNSPNAQSSAKLVGRRSDDWAQFWKNAMEAHPCEEEERVGDYYKAALSDDSAEKLVVRLRGAIR